MFREIIGNPVYMIFLLILLLVIVMLVWSFIGKGKDIGEWIFGYFRTLFGK